MPTALEVKFDKGLNTVTDYFSNPPGHCLVMDDYELNYGILQPRERSRKLSGSALSFIPSSLFYWRDNAAFSAATNGFIYFTGSGGIFRSAAAYSATNDGSITFSDITNALGTPILAGNFASLNNTLIFGGSSSNKLIKVTSNSATPVAVTGPGIVPLALRTVNNFMFAAADALGTVPSRVFWCNVGDPTTWTGANSVDVNLGDGDVVIALGSLGSNLLIFKSRSTWMLNTTTTTISGAVTLGPLTNVSSSIGCGLYDCVDNLPDGRCIFVGSDFNVYVTDGSSIQSLTNNPPPGNNISYYSNSTTVSFGVKSAISLRYYPPRNEIHFVSGNGVVSTAIWAYDIQQGYWRVINSLQATQLTLAPKTSTLMNDSLLVIDATVGNIINVVKDRTGPPSDNTNATITPTVSTAVQFAFNITSVSDLCLSILYYALGAVTYNIGFDNVFGSTNYTLPINVSGSSPLGGRYDIKIPLTSNPTTGQKPSSFMIRFKGGSGADFAIYKVYLSNEMGA